MTVAPLLRPVTDADRPLRLRVYGAARADELAAVPWPPEVLAVFLDQQLTARDAGHRAQHPYASWSVVVVDGADAGVLCVDRSGPETAVVDVALLPWAQGRGAGTAVLSALAAEGRPLSLAVVRGNPALRLYERLGFTVIGDDGVYLSMSRAASVDDGGSVEDGLEQGPAVGSGLDRDQEDVELAERFVQQLVGALGRPGAGRAGEQQPERDPSRGAVPLRPGVDRGEHQRQLRGGEGVAHVRGERVGGEVVGHSGRLASRVRAPRGRGTG
jgi:ribosomal protein S18 acetylase RimI-like enzyme